MVLTVPTLAHAANMCYNETVKLRKGASPMEKLKTLLARLRSKRSIAYGVVLGFFLLGMLVMYIIGTDGAVIAGAVLIALALFILICISRCPHCGRFYNYGYAYCPHCGERLH